MDWPPGLVTKALGRTGSSTKWSAQVSPATELGLQPVGAWSMPTVRVPPRPVTQGTVAGGEEAAALPHAVAASATARSGSQGARCRRPGPPPGPVTPGAAGPG